VNRRKDKVCNARADHIGPGNITARGRVEADGRLTATEFPAAPERFRREVIANPDVRSKPF